MRDRVARPVERMVMVLAGRIDLLAVDDRNRRGGESLRPSGHLAHMTFLAGHTALGRGRVPVLLPDDFKLDAQIDGNLMAGHAELGFVDLREPLHRTVDFRPALLVAGRHLVFALLTDDLREFAVLERAIDRLIDLTGNDVALAVDAAVFLGHAVTCDTGDAFARNTAAFPQRQLARLTALRPDLLVAADAERTDRTLGQRADRLLELVEHRRNRRIGMVRGCPFLVDLLVADPAFRSAGEILFRKELAVRILRVRRSDIRVSKRRTREHENAGGSSHKTAPPAVWDPVKHFHHPYVPKTRPVPI